MPSASPETTMDRQLAFLLAGARSPTSGSINWGVTVVIPQMNEMAANDSKRGVRHKPSHYSYISWHSFSSPVPLLTVNLSKEPLSRAGKVCIDPERPRQSGTGVSLL